MTAVYVESLSTVDRLTLMISIQCLGKAAKYGKLETMKYINLTRVNTINGRNLGFNPSAALN